MAVRCEAYYEIITAFFRPAVTGPAEGLVFCMRDDERTYFSAGTSGSEGIASTYWSLMSISVLRRGSSLKELRALDGV